MKILIVLPNDALGGAEQYLKMLASYYKHEEVSIYFLKHNKTNQWRNLENETKQYFMSSRHELFGLLKFCFLMLFKQQKYDYVFSSHTKINALLGCLRHLRIITTSYLVVRESTSVFLRFSGLKLSYYKLLYTVGYKKIDLIICQTKLMKEQFETYNSRISDRVSVKVIPNPINLINANEKAREKIECNHAYIVSAGRLITLKGFDILINAFYNIKKQYPKLKLIILGEGIEKQNLKTLAASLQLEKDVIFPGHVSNVYPYFKQAELCVVSSILEGFPNVLLQMMSQNNKIVSTLCAGEIETIPKIVTCKPNDSNALTNSIIACIKEDTSKNTHVFKSFLSKRTIDAFITTLHKELKKPNL